MAPTTASVMPPTASTHNSAVATDAERPRTAPSSTVTWASTRPSMLEGNATRNGERARQLPPGAAEGDMTVETRPWVTGRSDHVAEERGGRALGGEVAGPHG